MNTTSTAKSGPCDFFPTRRNIRTSTVVAIAITAVPAPRTISSAR